MKPHEHVGPTAAILLLIAALGAVPARAADPPQSCLDIPDCPLESDVLKFGEGDPVYEITGRITHCHICADLGGDVMRLEVDVAFSFGPYDPASCNPADADQEGLVEGEFVKSVDAGVDSTYVFDTSGAPQLWDFDLVPPLRTPCLGPGQLDYAIRDMRLSALGAAAVSLDPGVAPVVLDLPDNVRSTSGDRIDLPGLRFSASLGFEHTDPGPAAFWAEGVPARLVPPGIGVTYRADEIEIDAGAVAVYAPPSPCSPTGQCLADQVCATPPGLPTCSGTGNISNLGYLDHPAWSAPATSRILPDGLHASLELPAVQAVVYEPLFPAGIRLALQGPANVDVVASEIVGGTFAEGQAYVSSLKPADCPDYGWPIVQALELLGDRPIAVQPYGGLLAPVDRVDGSGPLNWTFNEVTSLGCGTLFVPAPPVADQGAALPLRRPDVDLLASAVPVDAQDRGLYAGINYNRTRACVLGASVGGPCTDDLDCPAGGWTCGEPWSPSCAPLTTTPAWSASIDGNTPVVKTIFPTDAGKELVFYVRGSGVTGVFDGGFGTVPTGGGGTTFAVQYENFGLAFRGSDAYRADSILGGSVTVPWPSDTSLPFEEMRVCTCGSLAGATLPQGLPTEKRLGYWDAPFRPYGFDFQTSAAGTCPSAGDACGGGAASAALACVQAELDVPHFAPEFDGSFDLFPDGTSTTITPTGVSKLEFEDNTEGLQPYRFDVGTFGLSSWTAAGSPTQSDVFDGVPGSDCGHYDGLGKLAVPHFGLSPAAIRVRRLAFPQTPNPPQYLVDLHDPVTPGESTIGVTTKFGADKITMTYRLDYLRPSALAGVGTVGQDENGRGLLFGFTRDGAADLKSVAVQSGFVADPSTIRGDVGVAASLRLWALTAPGERATALYPLLPPTLRVDSLYSGALSKLSGQDLYNPADLTGVLHASGAMDSLAKTAHPDRLTTMLPSAPLPIDAQDVTGALDFAGGQKLDAVLIDATMQTGATGSDLFSMTRGRLTVERFVEPDGSPISTFARAAGVGGVMSLPGEQSLAFPLSDALQWKLEFVQPSFAFKSLTGSLHVGQGGFGGIGFDELNATLKYYANGDWYFDAGVAASFRGKGAQAEMLLGNTVDIEPLRARDPDVARFLGKLPKFKGAYARLGVKYSLIDLGCPLYLSAGAQVGGWYLDGSAGGQVAGWVSGKGACLVSVKGKQKLIGGKVADKYKLTGGMWVAGGIGFCDEDDWDSPSDAFDDSWCYACVISTSITASFPPHDLDVSSTKPKTKCD